MNKTVSRSKGKLLACRRIIVLLVLMRVSEAVAWDVPVPQFRGNEV